MTLKVDVSLTLVYPDLAPREAMSAAAAHGFDAYETWWPLDSLHPRPSDLESFVTQSRQSGLQMASLAGAGGGYCSRGIGTSAVPEWIVDRHFEALTFLAEALKPPVLTMLYGNVGRDDDAARARAHQRFVRLARLLPAETVLSFEYLNPFDAPYYGLPTFDDTIRTAHDVADAAGRRVGVTLDTFHLARAGIDCAAAARQAGDALTHVQLADYPGRHEPGTATIDFTSFGAALGEIGYRGHVGLEYHPTGRAPGPDLARRLLAGAAGVSQ